MYSRQAYGTQRWIWQAYGSFYLSAVVWLKRKIGITGIVVAILWFHHDWSYGYSDTNLSSANLSGTNLSDADLSGANLSGTKFWGKDVLFDEWVHANIISEQIKKTKNWEKAKYSPKFSKELGLPPEE